MEGYLAQKGLWPLFGISEPFDWNRLYEGLLSHKLRPNEIASMTLTECLLYSLSREKQMGGSISHAHKKVDIIKNLSSEQRIELAMLRSGYIQYGNNSNR